MNNIYKVIWSKAKNCYVVASEIARSHTKSATGSEKIGGVTRRSLLASLMALSLLCGGLGVASAADVTVHVDASLTPSNATEVYTTTGVNTLLDGKADKTALGTKANATDVAKNTENIATNQGNIKKLEDDKLSKDVASATYATNKALNDLEKAVTNKVDESVVEEALEGKANTDLSNLTEAGKSAIKNTMLADMEKKANKADVYSKTDADDTFATKTELNEKADATELAGKANKTDLENATNRITANEGNINNLQKKTANLSDDGKELTGMTTVRGTTVSGDNVEAGALKVTGGISDGAGVTTTLAAINDSMTQTATNKTDIAALQNKTDGQQTAIDGLNTKTTQISYNAAEGTTVYGVKFKDTEVDANGKGLTGVSTLHTTGAATVEGALKADSLIVENASQLKGDVTMDKTLSVTGDTTLKGTKVDGKLTVTDEADLKNTTVGGTLGVTGEATFKDKVTMDKTLSVTGDTTLKGTKVDGKLTVTDDADLKNTEVGGTLTTTGKATFKEAVEMDKGLTVTSGDTTLKGTKVDGKLTVTDDAELKNTEVKGTLGVTGATTLSGELTAKENATFEKDVTVKGTTNLKNTTVAGDLKVTGTITTDTMVFGVKPTNYTEIDQGKVTSKNSYINGAGQSITSSSTFDVEKNEVGFVNNATGEQSYHKQTAKGINGSVTDKAGNTTYTKVTATENSFQVQDKDGKNKNHQVNTKDSSVTEITNADGKTTTTEQTATDITNTAKDGIIKNDAKDIVNDASGNISNKSQTMDTTVTGKATESYGELETTVNGKETHNVTGTKTENVTGKVTENYNGGQETNVTGDKKTTVTGNQTTIVTGDISNTAKNITNEATDTLTDKVGTNTRVTTSTSITDTVGTTTNRKIEDGKITDTAGDSTVVTENEKGTTFTKTGSTAYSTAAGAPTDTNIAGNHITTGRVDANELGVSDKDGDNTANLTVKAGEGVKASAGNGTTTGSLDVTAGEVGSSVTDASGKGSTFKQRIDAIMMESKNVSITAEEKLTNEAKVITNKASEVINNEAININNTATGIITSKASEIKNQADKLISNKVGENTSEYMEDGKITTSVKDGAKSTVTIQNADGLQTGVTNGTSTNASATTATSSAQTIASGNKANSVITTIDGTQFVNTDAAAPVTGESGAGTADRTTIKGNTITTGKVTMDYADVMKDLGVRGNANINGKTTTGSLEVTGTSTLKGNVIMESNATVKKDLNVEGTTTTKTLKVTENATVGGTLDVAKKATFQDSVDIAKDLSVGGDVTAKSYKVGDKTYISADGINANDQKITNVADGSISEGSKDAVNGGQLYGMKTDLEHKVDKVGANAAAMANLHPMEFDPDSKWNIAAAMGNYGSETATAIGAFYRPNEDVMVNFSTAFGTGENMVGGGVSVRLGKGSNKLSREESNALKAQVNDLTARMDALLSVLNPNMSKDFPDVPENHWAYEAVSRLAGNDIVQGYPDGEFHGERTMTRYEMAEIIYNALSRGAEAEKELVEEFKPELQAMAASEKATAERAEG